MIYTKLFNLYSDFYFHFYTGKKKQLLTPNKIVYLFALLKEKYKSENKKGCSYAVYYVDDEIFIPYLSSYLNIAGVLSYRDKVARAVFRHLNQADYQFLKEHMSKTEHELKEQILMSRLKMRKQKDWKYHFFQARGFIFAKKSLLLHNHILKRFLLLYLSVWQGILILFLILFQVFLLLGRYDAGYVVSIFLLLINTPIYIYMYIKWLILLPKKKVKKKKKIKK